MFAETFSQQTSNLKQGLKTFHENEDGDLVVMLILIAMAVLIIAAIYAYVKDDLIESIKENLCNIGIGSDC